MAKRRRLTPPSPDFLSDAAAQGLPADDLGLPPGAGLETKSMFPMGVARVAPSRPPIAQVAGEASALSALEGLSAELRQARAQGRFVESLRLEQIDLEHLIRDRMAEGLSETGSEEALIASLRARGQQVPVEVLDRGEGRVPRYGLISGWRRINALRAIARAAGDDPAQAGVLAIVRQPASAAEAYLAMVEENEIRSDISFYERARIVTKALEQGVFETPRAALQGLFGNVSRAKRSKIKSFMALVEVFDGVLRFPMGISERLGLDLVRRLEADPTLAGRLRAQIVEAAPQDAEAELALLQSLPGAQDRAAPDLPVPGRSEEDRAEAGVTWSNASAVSALDRAVALPAGALTEAPEEALMPPPAVSASVFVSGAAPAAQTPPPALVPEHARPGADPGGVCATVSPVANPVANPVAHPRAQAEVAQAETVTVTAQYALSFDPAHHAVRIAGAGVDAAFVAALELWLRQRQVPPLQED